MSKNKITIKDVAREAGVSTATVSYVVNNRTDVKISPETRQKVLQIINLLDYSPNQAAQALAAKRNSTIAIYIPPTDSILLNAENMFTLKEFIKYFNSLKYDVILLNDSSCEKCDKADAIICYNTCKESFYNLGNKNFIPLLALDCIINDPLFFQINSNLDTLHAKASEKFVDDDYTFVTLNSSNLDNILFYQEHFSSVEIVDSINDLEKYKNKNILVSDYVLYKSLREQNNILYIPKLSTPKLEVLNNCLKSVIARNPLDQHNVLV
ncbi:LacI family DNA-binding transcriptional regulator [Lachnobacterium bovis]|uniref:Regulatory protein, lacI family n=1 Tax=Lachnobacterium bovis TaxID=140626 RepID=A0A1H9PC38_9FIRM|nr:LacI family DNA-binding transcriptional regulator [Lachnobacterium bovis]SER45741.1 regulatory protein, lacI family [Lachnobacterium bovis]